MQLIAGIVAEIKRRRIYVLMIEPLKRAHQVDENDNTAVDIVVKAFAGIADEANCAVMLLHHTRKAGGGEITAKTSRGAKALVDGCRSVRVLNGMTKEEGERAGITDDHRRYFRVYPDKLNLAPPPDVSDWFKLESVHLGNGRDGSAATMSAWPRPGNGPTPSPTSPSQPCWRCSTRSRSAPGASIRRRTTGSARRSPRFAWTNTVTRNRSSR